MYYRDHEPAHFHAYSGEFEIIVEIESGVVAGRFPQHALGHVIEWYGIHKPELQEDWNLARESRPLKKIDDPLE